MRQFGVHWVAFSLRLNTKLLSPRNGFGWNTKEEKEDRIYLPGSVVTEFLSAWTAGKTEDGKALLRDSVVLLGEGRPQSQWFPKQVLRVSFLLSSPWDAHVVDIHLTLFCEIAYKCICFTGVWSEINQRILGDILPQANNTSHTPVFSPTTSLAGNVSPQTSSVSGIISSQLSLVHYTVPASLRYRH